MKKWEFITLLAGLSFCVYVYCTIITELKNTGKEIEEALLLEGKLQKINWKWKYLPINLNVSLDKNDLKELQAAVDYYNRESIIRLGTNLFEINTIESNHAYVEKYLGPDLPENIAGTVEVGFKQRPTIYLFSSYSASNNKKLVFTHELLHLIGFDHNLKEDSIMNYYYHKTQKDTLSEQDWDILKFVYSPTYESKKMIAK